MFRQGQRDELRKKKLGIDGTEPSANGGDLQDPLTKPLVDPSGSQLTTSDEPPSALKDDSSFTKTDDSGTPPLLPNGSDNGPTGTPTGSPNGPLGSQKSTDDTTKVAADDMTKVAADDQSKVGGVDPTTALKADATTAQNPGGGTPTGNGNGQPEVVTGTEPGSKDPTGSTTGDDKGLGAVTGGSGTPPTTETVSTDPEVITEGDKSEGALDTTTVPVSQTGDLDTGKPELGVPMLTLVEPHAPNNVLDRIKQETGKPLSDHTKTIASDLAKASQLAASLQADTVALASSIGATLAALVGSSADTLSGAVDQAKAQVGAAFEGARGEVDNAATTALSAIATAEKTGLGAIAAAADRNAAKADKLYADQSKLYLSLHAELLKPFAEAYKSNAGLARTDGAATAGKFDSLDKAIDATFIKGGTPLESYLGTVRAAFAKKKKPAAKADMQKGIDARATQVEGQTTTMSATITTLLAPLSARVTEIGTQAKAAVTAARKSTTAKLTADVKTGRDTVTESQRAARDQLSKDEDAAKQEIDQIGQRASDETTERREGMVKLFDSTAAKQSAEYKQVMEQAASQLPQGTPLTEEAGETLVQGIVDGLESLHDTHASDLDDLRITSEEQLHTGVQRTLDGLNQVVTTASDEAGQLARQKSEVIQEVAHGFDGALSTLTASIDVSLNQWTAPITTQLNDHLAQVRTKLATMLSLTQSKLASSHKLWKQEQQSVVDAFCKSVAPGANEAAIAAQGKVLDRAKQAFQAMRGLGTDENKLFDALRAMAPGEGPATEEAFYQVSNSGHLRTWIKDEFENAFESDTKGKETALAHLNGEHSKAAQLEIAYNINWYGDDEAQIEKVLRGLPEDQRKEIASGTEWDTTRALLNKHLDGNDLKVADALMSNNLAKADAIRLKENIDKARRKGDKDLLHDTLAGMDQEQIDKIAAEFVQLEGVSSVTPVDGNQARQLMAGYVTRDIKMPAGRTTYTNKLKSHDADLAKALIVNGKDSTEAKVSRFEVEMQRPGGPKDDKLEGALLADGDLKERLHSNDPKVRDGAKQELATQQAKFKEAYTKKYGKDAGESIEKMTSVGANKRDLFKLMLKDGYNTPEVAKEQIKLAVNGLGTDEDAIKRALGGMSPADIKQLKSIYPNLEKDLGVNDHKGFGSELSGQDRFDVEVLLLGDEKHMNEDERFQLAAKKYDQQRGSEANGLSKAMFGGSIEGEALEKNWTNLKDYREKNKAKFKDGKFVGSPEEYAEYRALCQYVGIGSELYQEQVDRVANAITTGVAIAGAVVATVATGGLAGPVIAALVTGVGSMAVNATLKGGRYGWEDATKDAAITVVSAATAGVGSKLTSAKEGATVWNLTSKSSQAWAKTGVAAGQGFVNSSTTTAFDDATWKNGVASGLGETLYQGGKGLTVGALSKGSEELLGGIKPLEKALNSTGGMTRGSSKAFVNGLTGMVGKTGELTYDTAGGKFSGDLDKWSTQILTEGGKNAFQGFLEGHGEAHAKRRDAAKTTTPAEDPTKKQEELSAFAEEAGKKLDDQKDALLTDAETLDTKQKPTTKSPEGDEVVHSDGDDTKREDAAKKLDDEQLRLNQQQEQVVSEIERRQKEIEQSTKKTDPIEQNPDSLVKSEQPVTEQPLEQQPKLRPENQEVETTRDPHGKEIEVVKDKAVVDDPRKTVETTVSEDAAKKIPSDFTDEEIGELQRRVRGGEHEDDVVLSMLKSRESSVSTNEAPSANKVLSDDEIMSDLQRMIKSGYLDQDTALKVLDGATPEDRHQRLAKLKQDLETDSANRTGYPTQLIDAAKATDPSAKAKLVQEAIDTFKMAGEKAAIDALQRLAGDIDAQAELAHHLAVYKSIITKTSAITDLELISLVRAHAALMDSTGNEDAKLRKFVDERAAQGMLAMKGRGGEDLDKLLIAGCVGDAKNTLELSADQAIAVLGLDYSWKNPDGTLGISPFVQDGGGGTYTAKTEAYFVEFPVSSEIAAKAQITVSSDLYERIATMAKGGDLDAQKLMTQIKPHDAYDPTNTLDPYTGKGGTAAGGLLGKGKGLTVNQERHMGGPAPLTHGAKMFKLDGKGQKVLVGTYLVDGSGKGSWVMAKP